MVAAARAAAVLAASLYELTGVGAALADRRADGRPHLSAQPIQVLDRQHADQPSRSDPGLPQHLVGEQVPDPGDRPLVEQAGLDRRAAGADPTTKIGAPDVRCVGADMAEIRVQDGAAEAVLSLRAKRVPSSNSTTKRSQRGVSPGPSRTI